MPDDYFEIIWFTKEAWVLDQTRTAVFYLMQCWSALFKIERIFRNSVGGSNWDVITTFLALQPIYLGRDLFDTDLTLLFDRLHELQGMDKDFPQFLRKKVRAEVLEQLRKANWTYERMQRIAKSMARRLKQNEQELIQQFGELASIAGDGCQIPMKDMHYFILGTPWRTPTS